MHGARIVNEVQTRPWITREEFRREQIAFEAIAAPAGGDEVPGRVNTASCQRENVVYCGNVEVERGGAVDTAAAAVTHHGVLDRTLLVATMDALRLFGAAGGSWKSRKGNAVIVSTSGQFHLAEKATPRNGRRSRGGA